MSIGARKIVSENMRSYIIKIHSYENKNLTGTFQNLENKKEYRFENFTQMVFQMEQFMDRINYPQAVFEDRLFESRLPDAEQETDEKERTSNKNVIATFMIKILFRQSASWQGQISWIEKDKQKSFRSVLELAKLIDSALM